MRLPNLLSFNKIDRKASPACQKHRSLLSYILRRRSPIAGGAGERRISSSIDGVAFGRIAKSEVTVGITSDFPVRTKPPAIGDKLQMELPTSHNRTYQFDGTTDTFRPVIRAQSLR